MQHKKINQIRNDMKRFLLLLTTALIMLPWQALLAWEGMAMPRLHVEGRYFKDNNGNIVNLHGFAQTYSPWFNERGTQWNNYDVQGCLRYNKAKIDGIMSAGWKMSFVRIHMDPYWSNKPGISTTGENDISAFDFDRFKKYLDQVFVPMAEYAVGKGLYVVMRPPGVCPEDIAVGDSYQSYLLKVWEYVSRHPKLRNHPNIMFELANEPVNIKTASGGQGGFKELSQFFQDIVDVMRKNCSNILLIPGLGWQSNYAGFADYPIKGENIGYAVHCYPGWYNSGSETTPDVNYNDFKSGWEKQIKPVSDFAPVIVTEMDWAPEKYDASWGKGVTGEEGGKGFGANFKRIADETGNVSYLIFTGCEYLSKFDAGNPASAGNTTFLNDPEACPWPTYQWYQDYAKVQYPRQDFTRMETADNGDGTFTNPLIKADFPDPDVVRVGDTYYMVSTTMHHFPGCTLLKSKDLVNWEYCANPLAKMSSNPEYNLEDGGNIYSKGDWANSLIYKDGTFYIMFNAFGKGDDAGGYLLSAKDPEGTWTMRRLSRGYYDPGMLVDNGKVYVVCGNTNLSVVELDENFEPVKEVPVDGGFEGLEGSHFYKIGDYYYIYSVCCAWPGNQWCFRSKNVFGPYEKKKVFDCDAIHQGALVQTQTGQWWTVLMRDSWPLGRIPYLLPVNWQDNWPVIGVNGGDMGTYSKPNVGAVYAASSLPTNDHFRDYQLGKQWQWNHNPDNSKWSLFDNPGNLRLYTSGTANNPKEARNSLTQRIFTYHNIDAPSLGTISLDVTGMKDGDMAGISVFQDPYGYIAVGKRNGSYVLVQRIHASIEKGGGVASEETLPVSIDGKIYLRAAADFTTNKAKFYYSTDNRTFTQLGKEQDMQYTLDIFVGNRFFIFNYATIEEGGYVDIDWFTTEENFSEDAYYDPTFTEYSKDYLEAASLDADKKTYSLLLGSGKTFTLNATFRDGHIQDVTTEAKYTVSDDDVVVISNGRLAAKSLGEANVTAVYTDPMGNEVSAEFTVSVDVFPLTQDGFDPSIYSTGTFDAATKILRTGQYGFGGWQYGGGLDLSEYKYIVIELAKPQSCGASFRLFDEQSYWSKPSMTDVGSNTKVVIELSKLVKDGTTTPLDLSHIYIAGFWSYGGGDIQLKDIYLSNDGENSVGISDIPAHEEDNVDVYTLHGIRLYRNVPRSEVRKFLSRGIYIIGTSGRRHTEKWIIE